MSGFRGGGGGGGGVESVSVRLCWREEVEAVVVVVVGGGGGGGGGCSCTPQRGVLGVDEQTLLKRISSGLSAWPAGTSGLAPHHHHHHHHHHHSPFCLPQKYLYNTSGSKVRHIHPNKAIATAGDYRTLCPPLSRPCSVWRGGHYRV